MTKTSTSNLKAHLSEFLKAAHEGEEIIVTDRDRPVARLMPLEAPRARRKAALEIRQPAPGIPPFASLKIKGIRFRNTDSTLELREDRDSR